MSRHIYFFTSPTCAPCKVVKPAIMELKEDYPGFSWNFVDTTNDPENLGGQLGVTHVPTMIAFDIQGHEIGRYTGSTIMGYYSLVKRLLKDL